jgi:hypothetical protein
MYRHGWTASTFGNVRAKGDYPLRPAARSTSALSRPGDAVLATPRRPG